MSQTSHTRTGTIQQSVTEKLDAVTVRNTRHGYITTSPRRMRVTTLELAVVMTINIDAIFERAAHRAAESKMGTAKFVDGFITASVASRRALKTEEKDLVSLEQQFPDDWELVDSK